MLSLQMRRISHVEATDQTSGKHEAHDKVLMMTVATVLLYALQKNVKKHGYPEALIACSRAHLPSSV